MTVKTNYNKKQKEKLSEVLNIMNSQIIALGKAKTVPLETENESLVLNGRELSGIPSALKK